MTTIELTPDVVFERADKVVPTQPMYWGLTSTTPRPKSRPKLHNRGYHSVESATLPTRGRRGLRDGSEYGIMISVKDIKGHPFVVLEDKDKHKHMVQAPENEANSSVLSSEVYPHDDDVLSSSDYHPASSNISAHMTPATPSPVPRMHPTGKKFGGRPVMSNSAKVRSRSLSPGRAARERKLQRARSTSPSTREHRSNPIDSENIKPVKGLIGFFEATSPTMHLPIPPKFDKLLFSAPTTSFHTREVSNCTNAQRIASPSSTVSKSSSLNSSADVSQVSQKSNLTVTSVDNIGIPGRKSEKRRIDLASPSANTSKGTFTLPKLNTIGKPSDVAPRSNYTRKRHSKTLPVDFHDPKPFENIRPKPFVKYEHFNSAPKSYSHRTNNKQLNTRPRETEKNLPYLPSYQRSLESVQLIFPKSVTALKTEQKKETTSSLSADKSLLQTEKTTMQARMSEDALPLSTHVTKAKVLGPSQMLLNKTRRRRSAHKVSTALSESEYSESEYSDAESLKLGEKTLRNDEEKSVNEEDSKEANEEISLIAVTSGSLTSPDNEDLIKQLGHRRTPSIKFEKIASVDVTKRSDRDEVDSFVIDKLEKRADELENDLREARLKVRDLETLVEKLEDKLCRTGCDLEIKAAENGIMKKEVGRLKKDLKGALSSDEEDNQSLMSLQCSLRTAHREKSALEESVTRLEFQKTTLKCQLQDVRREREDYEIEIHALKLEVEKLKSKAHEQERIAESAWRDLSRAKRQTEAQIHDLEDQLSTTEQKCREFHSKNSSLEKQLHEYKHHKITNASVDDQFNESMQHLEQSKLKALQDLEIARKEIDDKSREIREAERKNNALQEELRFMDNQMEEELKERESALADSCQLDQYVKDLKAQQQVCDREIEMLKKELENVNAKDKAAGSEIDKLQVILDQKETKLDSLSRKYRALQKQLDDGTLLQLASDEKIDHLLKDNEKQQREIMDLKNHLRKTEVELLATTDAMDEAHDNLEKSRTEAEVLRNKVSVLDNEAQDLKGENERIKSALGLKESALKNARDAISKIENQMKDYEESHSVAEKEKLLLEEDRERAKRELELLKNQVDSQSRQMGDADKTIKDLREKLADDMKSSLDGIERTAEFKKEIQRLQSLVDDKSQQVYSAEETIYRQKEVIEEMAMIQQNAEKATLDEMEKFMAETGKQFSDFKTDLDMKNLQIQKLEKDKRELEEELDELEQKRPQCDDYHHEKEEELINLSQKLRKEEKLKNETLSRLEITKDKLSNALNEIEAERSRSQMILHEKHRHEEETMELHDRIKDLEEKLGQEAFELANIKSHHTKTEMKLRDVLKHAQEETDKAIEEKDMLATRADALEKQVDAAEMAARRAENSKIDIENELQQQLEANYKLQQTLAALGIGHSPGGSDSPGSLLTSV